MFLKANNGSNVGWERIQIDEHDHFWIWQHIFFFIEKQLPNLVLQWINVVRLVLRKRFSHNISSKASELINICNSLGIFLKQNLISRLVPKTKFITNCSLVIFCFLGLPKYNAERFLNRKTSFGLKCRLSSPVPSSLKIQF
jgi:hypothetical protein